MCGRYVLAKDYEELKARFGLTQSDITMKPRYNIAPQTDNPVIVGAYSNTPLPPSSLGKGAGGLGSFGKDVGELGSSKLELMQWGLVPHWAKDPKIGYKMINARAESVHEKPSFREPFKKQRCLVPANGFYEWPVDPKNPKRKTPLFIHLKSDDLFAFAGIWSL
ncbi:MAG TPA: SOS response-associated peptidase, partial [candidate division Zixibacteria bacterium]|nr:SOS response-associated peptidase [candidate division Zixibacteria bacterium]